MGWDYLRGVAFILYFVLLVQTIATIWYYMKARRAESRGLNGNVVRPEGVLPSHVIDVGIVVMFFTGEAVYQNYLRIGTGFSWYIVLNPIMLLFANRAILLITHFERARYAHSKPLEGPK